MQDEIVSEGMIGQDGFVLGRLDRSCLRHDGPEHVLCFAPTRQPPGPHPRQADEIVRAS